jgi:hypothetical protein
MFVEVKMKLLLLLQPRNQKDQKDSANLGYISGQCSEDYMKLMFKEDLLKQMIKKSDSLCLLLLDNWVKTNWTSFQLVFFS